MLLFYLGGMMKNFFTPSEIAKLCEVSTGSVIRWIRKGKVPSSVTGGGHYRVHKEPLCKFLDSLHIPIPAGLSPWPEKKVLIVDDEVVSVIDAGERKLLEDADAIRDEVIQVDHFDTDTYQSLKG